MKESVQQEFTVLLNVYGVTAVIASAVPSLVNDIAEDFAHFRVESFAAPPMLSVRMHLQAPPYESVPSRAATVYTPRNVSFQDKGTTYIDYSGRALATLVKATGELNAYSMNLDLLYEVAFLFLLSQLSERLDELHIHRIHALGISIDGRGALVLLPMGGGKSTLAAQLLRDDRVRMLSDDSPMVTRDGSLRGFPLRIGILPGSESHFEPHQLRTVQRMEFGPKLLVRHEYFESRIVSEAEPGFLFVGRRSLSEACVIVPCSRLLALKSLIPNCVVGLGLFQGMEFVFHRGFREIFVKLAIAFSRLRNCIALVRRSQTSVVILGRNGEQNAATILRFLEERSRR
jgi:hypothetical protein